MMTMEKMKEFARLFNCEVIMYGDTVSLEFDSFCVELYKHFDVGMTEAKIFAVYNFLKPLREAVDDYIDEQFAKSPI